MTYGNFKKFVLAYVKRTAAHLTVDSIDCLGVAINSARKYSERLVDFEVNRVRAKVVIDLANGTDVSAITTTAGGPISVKTIKAATVSYSEDLDIPLDLISRAAHLNRTKRTLDASLRDVKATEEDYIEVPSLSLVRLGTLLYLSPNTASSYSATPTTATTVTVGLDVIKWLPDYSADNDTDWFLTDCYDYMVFRTVQMINAFLKEDVRIPINVKLLDESWRSVKILDAKLLDGAVDVSTSLD